MSDYKNNQHSGEEAGAEKYGDRRVSVRGPFSEKIENFWFHHKGKVIILLMLLLVLIITVVQCVGKRENDVMIAYSGSAYLSGSDVNEMQNLLSVLLGKELGDENALVGLTQYQVYSKEQIDSIRAETNGDGEQNFINSELNSENYDYFYEYVMTGDTAILMLEPWLYAELLKNDRLVPMSEIFETLPPSADGEGYGIVLGETDIYTHYGVLQKMPENTVMCFLKPYVFGKTSKDSQYELMKDTFRMIATFDAP